MAYLSPIEEEAEGDLHLIKHELGQAVGFECQFYQISPGQLIVEMETMPLLRTALEQA